MMKFTAALSTGLAVVVGLPALVLGGDELRGIEDVLDGTVEALEVVKGLHAKLEAGNTEAIEQLLRVTERPLDEGPDRDDSIANLYREISDLQNQVDALEHQRDPSISLPWHDAAEVKRTPDETLELEGAMLVGVSRGMDESTRAYLRALAAEPPAEARRSEEPAAEETVAAPVTPDYSSDALRQAQAAYRAEQFERTLSILVPIRQTAATRYWRARAHERLMQYDAADALYREVIDLGGTESEIERAKTDLEFLIWKRQFEDSDIAEPGEQP